MDTQLPLGKYLSDGIEQIVTDALRASLRSPREAAFLTRYMLSARRSAKTRARLAREGCSVPPFLIASITNRCNLTCKGCYAAENARSGCGGPELTDEKWADLFAQAQELGIGIILLAGGEPLMRQDVLDRAARMTDLLFPVFTNGTGLTDKAADFFDGHRNLVPVLSIEGGREQTDDRRGQGIYDSLLAGMDRLLARKVLFGASVTVTTENLPQVVGDAFVGSLFARGCRVLFYVEYVPVAPGTEALAPGEPERQRMDEAVRILRERYKNMIVITFPGDEAQLGGCLAAGRGFFHINARGGAEPCPFSPFSDTSLTDMPLKAALNSPLFARIRESNGLLGEHRGGCLLYEQRDQVRKMTE